MARKILLADDSVTAQNMGRKILTDAGYDVITVNNGSAALKRVAEQKPDLIVLDVYMPGYSGLEVCVRLKDSQDTARIPILLTVGKLEPFKPEEATRVRADGFIVKPFEASELLSALTRLEDRVVPAQAEGSRFGTSVSGIERFGGDPAVRQDGDGESDTGWKNRLRFPSKKKKEEPEPEPEPDFVTPSNFRNFRRGGKASAGSSAPFPVSGTPGVPQEPGLVPDIPRDITPEELDALSALAAKLDGPAQAAESVAPPPTERVELAASVTAPEALPSETSVTPVQEKQEAEVASAPVAEVEGEAEISTADTMPASQAAAASEAAPAEAVAVPVASEPAPVDRNDEPIFASSPSAAEEVASIASEEKAEAQGSQSVMNSEPSAPVETPKAETAVQADAEKAEEKPKVKVQEASQPVAAAAKEAVPTEAPAPSAEELAEALRLLTPSAPGAPQTLAEAGAALAEELSRGTDAGSRWVAEAVTLSPEESSVSLEAEMFRTFATASPSDAAASGNGSSGAQAEAVPAAVAASPQAAPEGHGETSSTTAAEESPSITAASATSSDSAEPEHKESNVPPAEEAPREEVAATTFADAVHRDEAHRNDVESVSASTQTVSNAVGSSEAHAEVSSSEDESGGKHAMSKDGKKGKSSWHQIRSGAPAAATDAVEAAKQTEETPKAMAAAAAADGTDAGAIASIVDSVLADLRPKIVEEIAKKLAKK